MSSRSMRPLSRFERDYGIPRGLDRAVAQHRIRPRAGAAAARSPPPAAAPSACLLASEDLAADLGAERGPDGLELAYCRQRFIVECRAADVVAVDCPYTFSDAEGVARETRSARRLGYVAKSLVDPAHAAIVNGVLTPGEEELRRARADRHRLRGRARTGSGRVELDGALVEVPTYSNAKRLIARARGVAAIRALTADRCDYPPTPFSLKYFSAPGWNGTGERSCTWLSSEKLSASLCTLTMSAFFSTSVLAML